MTQKQSSKKKIIGFIAAEEQCIACRKPVPLSKVLLNEETNHVEAWYYCKCGNKYGMQHGGGFPEKYRKAERDGTLQKQMGCPEQKSAHVDSAALENF